MTNFHVGELVGLGEKQIKLFAINDAYSWHVEKSKSCVVLVADLRKLPFEAGDTIEMLEDCSGLKKGEHYFLHWGYPSGSHKDVLVAWGQEGFGCFCQHKWKLIKKGDKVCKPTKTELHRRADAVTGWTKEADDIIELTGYFQNIVCAEIEIKNDCICVWRNLASGMKEFQFKNQCQKLIAFKETLHFLINEYYHEGAKVGDEVEAEVNGQKVKAKITKIL